MEESFQKVMRIIPETIAPQRRAMHLLPPSDTFRRRAPSLHPWLAAALLGVCAAAGAQAQTAASTDASADTPALGTVVVTASGREQQVKEAPASISVITREELDQRPYATLQDVMKDLEGVSVVGASANEKDIVIRGMPGEYTLILVDGRRQGTRETMNRGTAGVQSNLIPPLAAIERIEVVRGPMSSLYGADAMGGVINIITRKVPKQWSGTLEVGGIRQEDRRQGDSTLADFWIGGPLRDDVLGVQVYGKSRHRGEDDIFFPLNSTSGNFGNRDEELTAKLTLKPSAGQEWTFEAGQGRFTQKSTPGRSLSPTAAATTVVRTEHERRHWAIAHDGRWDFGTTAVSLYQEVGQQTQWRTGGRNPVAPELTNTVLDGTATLPLGRSVLKVGGQATRNELTGIAAQDAAPGGYGANVDRVKLNGWALFAEDEFFVTDRFTVTAGARVDDDDRYGRHWTPRLYGVYQLAPAWTLRGGIAKGFKAPTIRQSTTGYCMTTGGAGGATPGTLCGDGGLKPETSLTQEIGLRFDQGGSNVSATFFHNAFKNKVASYDTGVRDPRSAGRNIYVYDNIDRVTLRGLELGAGTTLARDWKLSGNYTFTDSRRKGGGEPAFNGTSLEGRPLDKTPRHVLNARVDWTATGQLSLYASASYIGKQYWAAFRNAALGVRERGASTTLDFGGQYAFNRNLSLKFAVLNLTDKVVPVDARSRTGGLDGNWMVDEGRRLFVALNASF